MSPDGLTSLGGYPGDDEKGGAMFSQVDGAKMREDLYQAAEWLRTQPFSNGKLGSVGFCFGGGVTNQLAVRMGANLAAGVPYYGGQPSAADVPKIKAPISAQNGEADPRITGGSAGLCRGPHRCGRAEREPHLQGRPARFPQRYDAALRRSGGEGSLDAHAQLVQQISESLNASFRIVLG